MREDDVDELVGQVVEERYRIETVLGAGGMGAVYRARHIRVGREVAIKVLHDHLVADPAMVARFEREAAIAARLAHKNLISVIDVGETATKQKLMVLELARGENLAAIIERGPLAHRRIVNLTAQILDGLEHAHSAGLVHRDLKPENIIIERDDHGDEVPRIVDFGIAVLRGDAGGDQQRLTTAGLVLGTPQYMAPEQAQGHEVDPRCDLFALGVIIYEMLGGRPPFDGSGVDVVLANITQEPPPILERTGNAVDPLLEAFARRLMARRRKDRFCSARAARDVLELIDTHRDAAAELLFDTQPCRARGTTAVTPFAVSSPIRVTPVPVNRAPRLVAPTVPSAPLTRVAATEPCALAATIEAPAPSRRRAPSRGGHRRRAARAAVPWKSLGLLAGAVLGMVVVAVIAGPSLVVVRWLTEVLR